jgi:citrate synthase
LNFVNPIFYVHLLLLR